MMARSSRATGTLMRQSGNAALTCVIAPITTRWPRWPRVRTTRLSCLCTASRASFAAARRVHGMWQSTVPSRFLDELPDSHVEVREQGGYGGYGGYGESRFDRVEPFSSTYSTPGWERAQRRKAGGGQRSREPMTIEGELVAKSVAEHAPAFGTSGGTIGLPPPGV